MVATAGYFAPVSFLATATVAGLSALSFAEMSARFPKAAGAAIYVQAGFGSVAFARFVGLLVAAAGLVSAAALANAFYGYLSEFLTIDRYLAIAVICIVVTLIAAWGVMESLKLAAVITIVEVGGLLLVIAVNVGATTPLSVAWDAAPKDIGIVSPIFLGAVLAFYAYIGFEDMVDLAEEVKDVRRTLPKAIGLTLVLTTALYTSLALIAVLSVPLDQLAASDAPMALLFAHGGGRAEWLSAIALFAIINGALVQTIMASRVLYGLASRGQMPKFFAKINPVTRTPVIATAFSGACVLGLASVGALAGLATATSLILLAVFAAVNLSLWRVKRAERQTGIKQGRHPAFAIAGCIACLLLIAYHFQAPSTH